MKALFCILFKLYFGRRSSLLPLPLLRMLGQLKVALHARVELLERLLALLGVLADDLHLLGQRVAALLHGLPLISILDRVVVDRELRGFDRLLKRAVLG